MYIPCQIVDTSSLESQASSGIHLRGLCCPCLSSQKSHDHDTSNRNGGPNDNGEDEDPELVFSRHRAALLAGHRFLTNQGGIWNLQNVAPPLPQMGPPPLPPRKLSSFFPPMEAVRSRRSSKDHNHDESTVQVQVTSSAVPAPLKKTSKEKMMARKISPPSVVAPPPIPQLSHLNDLRSSAQQHRGPTANIACPYLNPIDVAATSWEWDFGNSESLRSHNILDGRSPSDLESGATDRVNIWGDPPVVKKGLLMQQREKMMWSRWKERYFILTRDYLHCFRRLRSIYRLQITLSAMGQFIYKLRLANVEDIRWDTRRTGSRIYLTIRNEPTILLKSSDSDNSDALFHWYSLLQECVCMSKIRRQAIRVFSSEEDTNSSNSHPSQFSAAIIMNEDTHSHNSSYTLGTSSGTSGESSSQTDLVEIYRRRSGGRQSIIPSSSSNSASNIPSTPSRAGPHPPPNQRRASVLSSSSCGFYLHEPQQSRPSSILRGPTQLFKRLPLPALDSESEVDDRELQDILEGLPKRCANPTREMEVSSHTDSHLSSVPIRLPLRKQNSSPIYDINNNDNDNEDAEEIDEFDQFIAPSTINQSRCESRMTLREFVKTPWRSSSCLPPPSSDFQNSRLSGFPIPARRPIVPQRPMSSFSRPPPHGVFGGRKVLPTPWTKSNPTLQIGKGAAFARSNVIVCPSKLSADVTYLRRV